LSIYKKLVDLNNLEGMIEYLQFLKIYPELENNLIDIYFKIINIDPVNLIAFEGLFESKYDIKLLILLIWKGFYHSPNDLYLWKFFFKCSEELEDDIEYRKLLKRNEIMKTILEDLWYQITNVVIDNVELFELKKKCFFINLGSKN